jgi:hypothetical protein
MRERAFAFAMVAVLAGCKKAAPVEDKPAPGSGSAAATPPVAPPDAASATAPAWKLDSQPVELTCDDKPLKLPAPGTVKPPVDRTLGRAGAIAVCQNQASVAAACSCLAASVDKWAGGISAPGECEVQKQSDPHAQLVKVSSNPPDGATKSGGETFVLIARRDATWSPAGIVEVAPDIDFSETPKATQKATIARFESRPLADGTLLWIESRHETQEHSAGDLDQDGAAQATICVVPGAAASPAFCYKPLALGSWVYSFTTAKAGDPSACSVSSAATFAVSLEPGSATVRLTHGSDSEGLAGHYRLQ